MAARHEALARDILLVHSDFFMAVYGYRKMHAQLIAQGWDPAKIGRDQVMNVMSELGVQGVRRGRTPVTTKPAKDTGGRPDLVEMSICSFQGHWPLWSGFEHGPPVPLPHVGLAGVDPCRVVHAAVEAAFLGEVDGAQVRLRVAQSGPFDQTLYLRVGVSAVRVVDREPDHFGMAQGA